MNRRLGRRVPSGLVWPLRDRESRGDIAPPRQPHAVGIGLWLAALVLVTLGMLGVRAQLNEAHVALVYLLVVLGSSAYAGRALGLAVAAAAFVLFDWFFLPPYGGLSIANPLDWIVLFAFLGTSVVAAQLLYRAQAQAHAAEARAVEIDRLAVLGAETLNAGRALDALPAIAAVIRSTLALEWCEVYIRDTESETIMLGARSPGGRNTPMMVAMTEGKLVQWVVQHGAEAAEFEDGTSRVAAGTTTLDGVGADNTGQWAAQRDGSRPVPLRALYVPLRVRDRVVGVLGIGATAAFHLSRSRRRVLRALSYYAALGVERVRLMRDAEHADALRTADLLKDALLASVSHDLRTPLTAIKALANEIAASGDGRAVAIEQEADRLNGLVENLLDMSRLQAGGGSRPPVANEAEDLVGAALQRLGGRAAGRELRTTIMADGAVALIGRFDFTDTLRALVNLIENALKYSPLVTAVDVTVYRDDPWLAFAVADRGPGVPAAERDRIFEPFYRLQTSPPDVGGAGLGLSIARSLATRQSGSVSYEARDGGGSIFTLRVPALDPPALVALPTDGDRTDG